MTQEHYMRLALKQARVSQKNDEVPIGAVVVKNGEVIARAHNTRNASRNAVEHAELVAIERACKKLNDWRLTGCDLYVTLEPCVMCLGACYNARISNVYFGAYDLSGKGCVQLAEMVGHTLNHELTLHGGVLEKECSEILTEYFKSKR
ncbi:MAG: nucleoside deaminase [Clostridiales bacterium]|nr:nucleoside deaminase [Clostridiales bacterium]